MTMKIVRLVITLINGKQNLMNINENQKIFREKKCNCNALGQKTLDNYQTKKASNFR
jgi:hypothetical protein